jgi:hypothetical protein
MIKLGMILWVVYGRRNSDIMKVQVVKVGRKYFEIGADGYNNNKQHYLRFNENGYFYNTDKHCGIESHCFLTEDEALNFQQGHSLKVRINKIIDNMSYQQKIDFINNREVL